MDYTNDGLVLAYCGWCNCSIAIDPSLVHDMLADGSAHHDGGIRTCCNDPECRELEHEAICEMPRPYTPRY